MSLDERVIDLLLLYEEKLADSQVVTPEELSPAPRSCCRRSGTASSNCGG